MSVKVFETLHVYQNGVLAFSCQNDKAALQTGLSELPHTNNILIKRVVETHSYIGGTGFPDYQMPVPQKHPKTVKKQKNYPHYELG